MASSLEELLAEEGFKGRRSVTKSRSSFQSKHASMPPRFSQDQHKGDVPSGSRTRTERTRSDVSKYNLRGESPRNDNLTGRLPRDNLVRREKIDTVSKIVNRRSGFDDMKGGWGSSGKHSDTFQGNEIVEVDEVDGGKVRDKYYDEMESFERREKYFREVGEKETFNGRTRKDKEVEKRHDRSSSKNLSGSISFSNKNLKRLNQPEDAYGKSSRGSSSSKSFDNDRGQNQRNADLSASEPALDKAAIQAIVSILIGHINHFIKNEDFRITVHHNCFSSLGFMVGDAQDRENKVIANLEQAIEIVERAAEEPVKLKELKRASLQLSMITGLSSNDLKDEFTSGVPNYRLSACAHIYLGVIYKIQKKDRVSAKHLLQVFCDSPFQARTNLLPELWNHLFLPHLSHLKVWFNKEAALLVDTPGRPRKLKLLEKVYNEIMDSGTYQFAIYFKDWLTEGLEAPSIPSIHIPSKFVQGFQRVSSFSHSLDAASPSGSISPQPMVSKKLYDSVFGRSSKPGIDEGEYNLEGDSLDSFVRSSDGSTVEDKQTLLCSSETVKHIDGELEGFPKTAHVDSFPLEDGFLFAAQKDLKLIEVRVIAESTVTDTIKRSSPRLKATGDAYSQHALSHVEANELQLKNLANSAFKIRQKEDSVNVTLSYDESIQIRTSSEGGSNGKCLYQLKKHFSDALLHGTYGYFDEGSFFSDIPQDFICPLTGKLFEDPVTLETGQTFERKVISEWLDQGNRTCPVTGKTLETLSVPFTNYILKRVIESWKSENCRHLLDLASKIMRNTLENGSSHGDETAILVLEQVLTSCNWEERIINAKHLLCLGGLQFLFRRFEYGNIDEKARVAGLLSCCIEADAGCRNQITRSISKNSLLELLHSKQSKARANAVLLLVELICLSRRKEVSLLLSGFENEEIVNTMHILLLYLQSSSPAQRPLVSVLLLYLDLLAEPKKYSIYREEAVDAITIALNGSIADEMVCEKCCRALLILGGRFTNSGQVATQTWVLKKAGFTSESEMNDTEENLVDNCSVASDDEEQASEVWLRNVSASLLSSGKRSFIEAISGCLRSGNSELVGVCLSTIAWLSSAICSVPDAEFHLSAFSSLVSNLKEILENGQEVEHRVLASMSLLNFSRIPECRVLLMTIKDEIKVILPCLAQVTWTAKKLYTVISGEYI